MGVVGRKDEGVGGVVLEELGCGRVIWLEVESDMGREVGIYGGWELG